MSLDSFIISKFNYSSISCWLDRPAPPVPRYCFYAYAIVEKSFCVGICPFVSDCVSLCVPKTLWTLSRKPVKGISPNCCTNVFGLIDVLIIFWGEKVKGQGHRHNRLRKPVEFHLVIQHNNPAVKTSVWCTGRCCGGFWRVNDCGLAAIHQLERCDNAARNGVAVFYGCNYECPSDAQSH